MFCAKSEDLLLTLDAYIGLEFILRAECLGIKAEMLSQPHRAVPHQICPGKTEAEEASSCSVLTTVSHKRAAVTLFSLKECV